MAQDTRKDPRAKVLTMTVRYKSATLDEFIEHHSYDISRGGMFIKTPSPFPPGTLLKFEVKIAEDQKLMQGVGRVVWKRESGDANADRPAGMGVKFIKTDEGSKRLIDQLVTRRGEGQVSAFDQGEADARGAEGPATSEDRDGKPVRKATMIGLGSLGGAGAAAAAGSGGGSTKAGSSAGFFPETDPQKDIPAPEDRTVMKQAAELLEDALREAGGSMAEVGDTKKKADQPELGAAEKASGKEGEAKAKEQAKAQPREDKEKQKAAKPAEAKESAAKTGDPQPAKSKSLAAATTKTGQGKKGEGKREPGRAETSRERPRSERPRRTSIAAEDGRAPGESAGSSKTVVALLGVAAAAGIVFYATREQPAPEPEPPLPSQAAVEPEPEPEPEPNPEPEPVAEPGVEDSDAGEAADAGMEAPDAAAKQPVEPAAAEKPAPKPAPPAPVVAKPKPPPAPVVAKPPAPKPAPEPKPAPPSTATPKPEAKPAEPKPEPKPAQPKPAPKPAREPTDNPY